MCFTSPQAQLVYEAGQIKGSIAMTHPDRIHAGKPGGSEHGGGDSRGSFCHGTVDSKPAAHLLEMVSFLTASGVVECVTAGLGLGFAFRVSAPNTCTVADHVTT